MTRIKPTAAGRADEFVPTPDEAVLLRQEITTLAGTVVRFDAPQVRISADVKLSFDHLYGSIPAICGFGIKRYVKHLTARKSPGYVSSVLAWLAPLARKDASEMLRRSLSEKGIIGYHVYTAFEKEVAKTVSRDRVFHYLSAFVRWYEFCVAVGQPGFDEDVAADLSEIIFPAVLKGQAVLREDPDEGPLTTVEFDSMISRLNVVTDKILLSGVSQADGLDLDEVAFTWLLVCYGTNAKNLRYLNEGDFRPVPQPGGQTLYEISIPRIKKRLKGERIEFRKREVPADVYKLLDCLRKRNRRLAPIKADRHGIARPLFRRGHPASALVGTAFERDIWRQRSDWPNMVVNKVAAALAIPKTDGGIVSLHPRRFRYTFATRLVANGFSSSMVADALDHSDTSHVMVYFNTRGEIVRRLDKALALSLGPVVQAFLGKIVLDETEAVRGGDPASRIRHHSSTLESLATVGNCGTNSFCRLYAPIACYRCRHFQPHEDGPHAQVLEELDTLRTERHAQGLPPKIVQIHDLTMLAIGDVIDRCEERKRNRGKADVR